MLLIYSCNDLVSLEKSKIYTFIHDSIINVYSLSTESQVRIAGHQCIRTKPILWDTQYLVVIAIHHFKCKNAFWESSLKLPFIVTWGSLFCIIGPGFPCDSQTIRSYYYYPWFPSSGNSLVPVDEDITKNAFSLRSRFNSTQRHHASFQKKESNKQPKSTVILMNHNSNQQGSVILWAH